MKVKVIVPVFGTYKEGDELEMNESTAHAVVKSGMVELVNGEKPKKEVKK